MEICQNCNGVGLVSTGADRLNLNHGNKITCSECKGVGRVASSSGSPVDNSVSPKAAPPQANQESGAGSSGASVIVPKVGDPCITIDERPGTLIKDERGAWVCIPDA